MNRFRILLPLIMLFLSGCTKDSAPAIDHGKGVVRVRLTGNNQIYETKLSLGAPQGTTIPFLWDEGDRLGLYVSSNNVPVGGNQNVKANMTSFSGDDSSPFYGHFIADLQNLSPNTEYRFDIYFPYFADAGTSVPVIKHRLTPHQIQKESNISDHLGRSGSLATAEVTMTTPSSLDGYSPDMRFVVNHKTSYILYSIKATKGTYSGWKVKRITLSAPAGTYLSGNMTYNLNTKQLSLDETSYRTNTITLDILNGIELSATAKQAFMVVFPADMKSKSVTFSYTLENSSGSQSVVLHRTRTFSATTEAFKAGTVYNLDEIIPAAADGVTWTSESVSKDISGYIDQVRGLITYAGIPSIQLKFTSNLEDVSFAAVNTGYYETATRQEVQPISTHSVYQAASISKIVLAFIVMQLNDRAVIDLDKPLWEYYPGILDYFADDDNKQKAKLLTPRICLIHRTGLNNTTYSNISFLYDPDSRYIYSGPGIYMLQRTIEEITGKTLTTLAKEKVFTPLGMTNSSYAWETSYDQTALHGFYTDGTWGRNPTSWSSAGNAAYTLRTTAEDMTIFMKAMMRGYGLSRDKYEEMLSAHGEYIPAAIAAREKNSIFRALG
ncbi:MAG: serine hydrolase, partial [Bacteroidales bacterium]|nr:serine hydrolase [Bacteroidales bacterium]